jgi:hypothetical protein
MGIIREVSNRGMGGCGGWFCKQQGTAHAATLKMCGRYGC